MKTLSIQQPYATLVVAGVKTEEYRTWLTPFRGRIYVHASGDSLTWPSLYFLDDDLQKCVRKAIAGDESDLPEQAYAYKKLLRIGMDFYGLYTKDDIEKKAKKIADEKGYFLPAQAIVGEVDIVDIHKANNGYAWILTNPVMYSKPIYNVMGKLRLWEYKE